MRDATPHPRVVDSEPQARHQPSVAPAQPSSAGVDRARAGSDEKARSETMRETTVVRSNAWLFRVVLLVAVALAGVVLIAGRPAEAHDHQVPGTVLKKGARDLQAGRRVIESSWDRPSGDGLCVNENAFYSFELPDGTFNYPEVDRVAAGSELRVRIFKAQRPDSFEVEAYRTLDENGAPSGDARMLNRSLDRVVREGKTVAWDAAFSLHRPSREYYLISEGHWQDTQGCGSDQFAFWSFHVKTGSAS